MVQISVPCALRTARAACVLGGLHACLPAGAPSAHDHGPGADLSLPATSVTPACRPSAQRPLTHCSAALAFCPVENIEDTETTRDRGTFRDRFLVLTRALGTPVAGVGGIFPCCRRSRRALRSRHRPWVVRVPRPHRAESEREDHAVVICAVAYFPISFVTH